MNFRLTQLFMNNNYNGYNPFFQQQPPQTTQMHFQSGNMSNFPAQNSSPIRPTAPTLRTRQRKPKQQSFNLDNPENVKKEIVIFKLAESSPANVNPETVDLQLVKQILIDITGTALNIKAIKRLGKYTPEKCRRVVVQFNTIKDQQLVISKAGNLNNFLGYKHLSMQPYRPHKEKNGTEANQDPKSSKIVPIRQVLNFNNSIDEKTSALTDDFSNPFINFESEDIIKGHKQINILVIGATGVGKSTWINGIANYMSFNTFDDALAAKKPLCLIPMNFKLSGNETKSITMSSSLGTVDENEGTHGPGQSCTQEPKVYQYITDTVTFNLIDTPGICDTRGVEADIQNIDMIMECMLQWEEIHGICLLLKPNQDRLILPFKYCIEELLINLHKKSIPNIAVVFTNARSNFYRPGSTMDTLAELFKGVQNATGNLITLEDENTFCLDNEAIKVLYAKHKGVKIDKNMKDNAANSWDHTVKETYRLFNHFADSILIPHITYETKATTQMRGMLTQLATIMANTNDEIFRTRIVHDEQLKQLKSLYANVKERQNLTYQGEYVENTPLLYPVTVCCGQNCFETVKALSSETPDKFFKRTCCQQCHLKTVIPDHMGHVNLRQCEAFSNDGNCKKCGCSWQLHKHFWYSQKKVMGNFSSSTNQDNIDLLNKQISIKNDYIQQLQNGLKLLEQNNQKYVEFCRPCCEFLAEHSIITLNTAFEDYVTLGIKVFEESSKIGDDQTKLEKLKKFLAVHQQQKCVITSSQKNATNGNDQKISLYNYNEHISSLHEILGSKLHLASRSQPSSKSLNYKTVTCKTKVKQADEKIKNRKVSRPGKSKLLI